MSTKKTLKPGRPRDETIRIRILETAVTILVRRGYRQATMNDIALRARVGKQTLYRWWKNRAELLMEALLYYAEENVDARGAEGEEALENFFKRLFGSVTKDSGVILKSLVAEAIADKKFSHVFFNTFIAKRQQTLATMICEHSSLTADDAVTVNALVDIIFGAMWYRVIFEHRPLDDTLAAFLSKVVKRAG